MIDRFSATRESRERRDNVQRPAISSSQTTAARISESFKQGPAQTEGDEAVLHEFISLLDTCEFWFNIVTPSQPSR
jgi:alkyl sulfatase BDS1-like metallo-beta-lactamase superfamily hydrolase